MNVLFLTHRLPYAPNRGDRIRAYHLMREMSRFARVSLFSFVHDDDEGSRAADVPFAHVVKTARVPRARNFVRGALQLPSSRPLTHSLLHAPEARQRLTELVHLDRPDLVFAYCSGMARLALEPPLDTFPLVVDFVDIDSAKWLSLSERAAPPRRWVFEREARTLAAFEGKAARRARAVFVVNERELRSLQEIEPSAPVHVLRNGIDITAFAPPGPPSESPVVVFCGVMDYHPNAQAVAWFAEHVWPGVRAALPAARFVIAGANPSRIVMGLGARDRSIEITGRVDSVQPHLWGAAVAVAPLRVARGVQNKVLEAMAAGLPNVITSAVRDGLPAGVERGCTVADDPDAMAHAILSLLKMPADARRSMALAGGVDKLTWQNQLAPLRAVLTAAGCSGVDVAVGRPAC